MISFGGDIEAAPVDHHAVGGLRNVGAVATVGDIPGSAADHAILRVGKRRAGS